MMASASTARIAQPIIKAIHEEWGTTRREDVNSGRSRDVGHAEDVEEREQVTLGTDSTFLTTLGVELE